jgi:hypothetical protein
MLEKEEFAQLIKKMEVDLRNTKVFLADGLIYLWATVNTPNNLIFILDPQQSSSFVVTLINSIKFCYHELLRDLFGSLLVAEQKEEAFSHWQQFTLQIFSVLNHKELTDSVLTMATVIQSTFSVLNQDFTRALTKFVSKEIENFSLKELQLMHGALLELLQEQGISPWLIGDLFFQIDQHLQLLEGALLDPLMQEDYQHPQIVFAAPFPPLPPDAVVIEPGQVEGDAHLFLENAILFFQAIAAPALPDAAPPVFPEQPQMAEPFDDTTNNHQAPPDALPNVFPDATLTPNLHGAGLVHNPYATLAGASGGLS